MSAFVHIWGLLYYDNDREEMSWRCAILLEFLEVTSLDVPAML